MTISQEQLKNRKKGIGASDAAAVLGLSKWGTDAQVFLEKTSDVEQDYSEAAHFGNVLEQVVADEYARRMGCKVRKNNKTLTHKDHDFIICHLDRVVEGQKKILECKTASEYLSSDWGDEFTDQIPDEYIVQVQHQMAVTGCKVADVSVLIGGNKLRIYTVKRDEELIEYIISEEVKFWKNYVINGVMPPIDYDHRSTYDLIKKMYPGTDGSEININEISHWHNVKLDAMQKVKYYQSVIDASKNHILEVMGESSKGNISGIGSYTRKLINRKGFTVEPSQYMKLTFKKEV